MIYNSDIFSQSPLLLPLGPPNSAVYIEDAAQ